MKSSLCLSLCLLAFSPTGLAQTIDYDQRNLHIFCASHLAVVSESLDKEGDEYQALEYLSGMHRTAARRLQAEPQHFVDVVQYLKRVRASDPQKWQSLSDQSKRVCLPDSQ